MHFNSLFNTQLALDCNALAVIGSNAQASYKKPNYDILIDDKAVNSIFDWDCINIAVKKVYNAHEDEIRK